MLHLLKAQVTNAYDTKMTHPKELNSCGVGLNLTIIWKRMGLTQLHILSHGSGPIYEVWALRKGWHVDFIDERIFIKIIKFCSVPSITKFWKCKIHYFIKEKSFLMHILQKLQCLLVGWQSVMIMTKWLFYSWHAEIFKVWPVSEVFSSKKLY